MHTVSIVVLVIAGFGATVTAQSDFCDCLQNARQTCREQVDRPANGGRDGGDRRGGRGRGRGGFDGNGADKQSLTGNQRQEFRRCYREFKQELKNGLDNNRDDQCSPRQCGFRRGRGGGRKGGDGGRFKRSHGGRGPRCPDDMEDKTGTRYQMKKCMYDTTRACFQNNNCPANRDPCSAEAKARQQLKQSKKDECYQRALQVN